MRTLLLAITAAALVPGCGGGGGGGGGGSTAAVPPNAGPAPTPLSPVDTSTPTAVINTSQSNAAIITDLQAALTAGGIITFDNVAPLTITLTTQLTVPVLETVVLDGNNLVTIDGNLVTRCLEKDWMSVVTLQRLSFVNGRTPSEGGAIKVTSWDGALTVINCSFTNCKTTAAGPDIGGGAIRANGQTHLQVSGTTFTDCDGSNGGAIACIGSRITLVNCSFTQCDAFGTGGGADAGPTGQGGIGGAVYVDGVHQNGSLPRLDIASCTFTNNSSGDAAGALFAYSYPGTGSRVLIDTCTFSGNSTSGTHGQGGAVYQQENELTVRLSTFSNNTASKSGGALWSLTAAALIENSTFSGNTATSSPGFGGALWISGAFWIYSTTIANNVAGLWGGGIWTGSAASVTLRNSLLQNNTGTDPWNGWNTNATLADGGNNLQWPTTRGPGGLADTPATATVVFANALLGALAANGGPTQTMSIPAASPAENAGSAAAPTQDQRGMNRVGAPDIGAFEKQ